MDLLSKRYASPYFFIDGMIQTGRFDEFVTEFMKTVNHDEEEKTMWEYYLHRVLEGSYQQFKDEIRTNRENQTMSKQTIEATVKNSMDILKDFKPTE